VKPRWARDWVGTEAYTRVFTQAVRWLTASADSSDVQTSANLDRGVLTVTVDAFDAEGGFRNFLEGEARFIAPDLSVRSVPLQQSAPGRYVARNTVKADGSHLVGVVLKDGDGNEVGRSVAEAAQPYSPEYKSQGGGGALLAEVARVGHGRLLTPTDAKTVFAPPNTPRLVPHALWPPLVILAALLWLIDAAIRRLEWPLWGRSPVAAGVAAAPSRGLPSRAEPPRRAPAKAAPLESAELPPAFEEQPEPEVVVEPPPVSASEKYVGGLLAARRRARRREDSDE
jgi:hypothetical protein